MLQHSSQHEHVRAGMGSNPVNPLTQLNKEPTASETVSHRHLYAVTMTTVSATTTISGL